MGRRVLKPLRLAAALIVLVALTAAFGDFRNWMPAPASHWLAAMQFAPALAVAATGTAVGIFLLGALVLLTLAFGRVYCSVICPLGLLQDAMARIATWIYPRRRLLPFAPANRWLRYGFLTVIGTGLLFATRGVVAAWSDPYSAFGRFISVLVRPLLVAANNLLVPLAGLHGGTSFYNVPPPLPALGVWLPVLLFGIILTVLVVWRGRIYCNTFCPVGTVLGFISRKAAFRLTIDPGSCHKCASCLKVCKAQCIDLRHGTLDASRCVGCFNCVSACNEHSIAPRFMWKRPASPPSALVKPPATLSPDIPADPQRRALLSGMALLLPAALLPAATETSAPSVGKHAPVTPPGSKSRKQFLDRCTACQLCVSNCPTQVLQPAWLEYGLNGLAKPYLDYHRAFCNFDCRRCGEVCPEGAISLLDLAEKRLTSLGIAQFDHTRCIVETKGTDCAACSEHCPTKAVDTVPFRTNLRIPKVNEGLCIGCGACEFACPVRPERAIQVAARPRHMLAYKPVEAKPAARPTPAGDFPF